MPQGAFSLPATPVDKLLIISLLVPRNDASEAFPPVSGRVLLATMEAQQAVAIRFVGRRVTHFDVPFFYALSALRGRFSHTVPARVATLGPTLRARAE
jgi:hypothetical protein